MSTYDYPPYPYLEQVLKNCPNSGSLYLKLWADRGVNNKLIIRKKQVQTEFLMTKPLWIDRINKLVAEGVVSYWETKDKIKFEIELTDYDFESDSHVLC